MANFGEKGFLIMRSKFRMAERRDF